MNSAIISRVNSADNDQKLSPLSLSLARSLTPSLQQRLLQGTDSGDTPPPHSLPSPLPLLLFHGLFKDLARPTNHYF